MAVHDEQSNIGEIKKTVLCNTLPPPGRLTVGRVLIRSLMRQEKRQNVGVKRRENISLRVRKSPRFRACRSGNKLLLIRMTPWACVLRRGRSHLSTSFGLPPITRCGIGNEGELP